MTREDELLLSYVAGMLTVAIVLPVTVVAAIRFIPPIREATRGFVVRTVDERIARARAGLRGDLQAIDATVAAIIRTATGAPVEVLIHNEVAIPAADAALGALGA